MHVYETNGRYFNCTQCNKSYSHILTLKHHEYMNHKNNVRKKYLSKEKFPCFFCDKIFNVRYNRKSHMIAMHSESTFTCDICNKPQSNKDNLKRHIKISHEQEKKTFFCESCDFSCLHNKSLQLHYKKNHSSTFIKSHSCDICHKTFFVKGDLTTHLKKVHQEFTLKCCFCDFNVKSKIQMSIHLARVHNEADKTM